MAIYFYGCISLDGYLADKNHEIEWLHKIGSVEETGYHDFYKEMDITVMGRKTYDAIKNIPDVETFYHSTQNYVFTHQKNYVQHESFEAVSGDIVEWVNSISKDKNIWIVGGNALLAPLLEAHIVDRLYIQIAPVLLGEGIPLFTQKSSEQMFKLVETKKYGQIAEVVLDKQSR